MENAEILEANSIIRLNRRALRILIGAAQTSYKF